VKFIYLFSARKLRHETESEARIMSSYIAKVVRYV